MGVKGKQMMKIKVFFRWLIYRVPGCTWYLVYDTIIPMLM